MPKIEIFEKVIALATAALGQAPWVTTITGAYPLSLYQPGVYHGKELFLAVPIMVAIVASWAVMRWRQLMWAIFAIFIVVAVCVYWIFDTFPVTDPIHAINWVLSYCAFALLVAALGGLAMDLFA
jgi:hypothetical protein